MQRCCPRNLKTPTARLVHTSASHMHLNQVAGSRYLAEEYTRCFESRCIKYVCEYSMVGRLSRFGGLRQS